jgi:hypothetical protein
VGTGPPVELEVSPPARPVAAVPTQPQGSGEEVAAAPAAELAAALPLVDATAEALVPEGAAGGAVG